YLEGDELDLEEHIIELHNKSLEKK
ncbi:MAG: hypothetical protein ACI9NN_002124, partial [Bacteroidia bacterium]